MSESCRVDPIEKTASAEELQSLERSLFSVEGMGCPNCAARVRNSLLSLHGVVEANILLELEIADVAFNPSLAGVPALIEAVMWAGGDGQHTYRAQVVNGPGVDIGYHA